MIYYVAQFLGEHRKMEIVESPKQFIVEVIQFGRRAFHLRLITLCSTCVFQLPHLSIIFFSVILNLPTLFVRHLLFIHCDPLKEEKRNETQKLDVICCVATAREHALASMNFRVWYLCVFVCVVLCAQQRKCSALVLSMTLLARNQMLYQLIYTAAASNDMAAYYGDDRRSLTRNFGFSSFSFVLNKFQF